MAKKWTDAEIEYLTRNAEKLTHAEMARHLGRPVNAVCLRSSILGLKAKKAEPYSGKERFAGNAREREAFRPWRRARGSKVSSP